METFFSLSFWCFQNTCQRRCFKNSIQKNVVKTAKVFCKFLMVFCYVFPIMMCCYCVPGIFFGSETFLHMYCLATLEVLSQLALLTSGHSFIDDCSRPLSNECIELYIYLLLQHVRKILQQLQFKYTYVSDSFTQNKGIFAALKINTCIIAAPLWMYW